MPKHRALPATVRVSAAIATLTIGTSLALQGYAQAQGVSVQEQAPSAAAGSDKLGDIVVTANRKAEKLHDVASSASVLGGEALAALGTANQDVRVLAFKVPSLNVESSNGRTFPRFYIRGYGNTDYSSLASQPVSLVYDEVDQENPNLKGFPIFDTADIQVLRGPQGTLFGRNSPAGVVSVQSVKPVLGVLDGYATVSEGTYDTASILGVVNIPLGQDWALRISAQEEHRDDWIKDSFQKDKTDGYDDLAGRAQLLYKPSSDFSALLNVHGRYLNGHNTIYYANNIQPGTDKLVKGFDPDKVATDGRNSQSYRGAGANLRVAWNLGPATLYSVSGWEGIFRYFSLGDVDGGYAGVDGQPAGPSVTPFPSEGSSAIKSLNQFTQEFRLQSNGDHRFGWLLGAYYFNERTIENAIDWDAAGLVNLDNVEAEQKNDAAAIFGSATYRLSNKLNVRVGARYTHDHKMLRVLNVTNIVLDKTSGAVSANNLSWDASATYALTRGINLYVRAATGFRAPSFAVPTAYNGLQIAKSEKNTSYEGGFKSYLWDRRIGFDLDFYAFNIANEQLSVIGGANNAAQLINAKHTIGRGSEAELRFQASRTLAFPSPEATISLG